MASLVVALASCHCFSSTMTAVRWPSLAGAGDDEIDAFAGLRDVELDRHAGVVRNAGVLQHRVHVAE